MGINMDLESQINEQRKTVDFDTREFTIEILVDKYEKNINKDQNELYVPDYQREFVWDDERQSKFIESLLLGLPIPLIFVAEGSDGRLEIVDGSQRIRTLAAFINNNLTITGLQKLNSLNGCSFDNLVESRKRKFRNIPIRMIVLSDQTTEDVRNDIFERINKGSDLLMDMEKRKGIYRGKFCDFIYNECAKNEEFIRMTPLSDQLQNRQEREELILRFFALEEDYPAFSNLKGIANYLDTYLANMNEKVVSDSSLLEKKFNRFKKMVSFVSKNFEFGFAKNKGMHQVSRVYFEAISIGSIKALDENPKLETQNINTNIWLSTGDLINIVSGKYRTHNKEKIKERIDYVKNKLLSAE